MVKPGKRQWRQALKGSIAIGLMWLTGLGWHIATFSSPSMTAEKAIVLGAAINGDQPSPVFKARIDHAIDLLQSGQVKYLIFTGGIGEGKTLAESEVAQAYALEKGISNKQIFIETASRTTYQNLQESRQFIDHPQSTPVMVISDPLHLARAKMIMNRLDIKSTTSATPYSRYRTWKTQLPFLLREIYFWHHHIITGR